MGNWILNLICFLQFFDLRTPSAAKMRFYFLLFLQGKNAQNRPQNQQNWFLAKNGHKSDNFMKWKALRQYLGNVWNLKVVLEFWFCHQKCYFLWSENSHLCQKCPSLFPSNLLKTDFPLKMAINKCFAKQQWLMTVLVFKKLYGSSSITSDKLPQMTFDFVMSCFPDTYSPSIMNAKQSEWREKRIW